MQIRNQKKAEFLEAAARAYNRGLQTGNGGNLSVRLPEEELMIVKPSGVAFVECSMENLVITDFEGNVVEGDLKPTREVLLHGAIYANVPHVGGVMHTHSTWSILWSLTRKDLPLITQHAKLKLGYPIANMYYDSPVVPKEGIAEILELFTKSPNLKAFILGEHGIVAVGKDILEAEHNAEFVEETAQISWLNALGGKIVQGNL